MTGWIEADGLPLAPAGELPAPNLAGDIFILWDNTQALGDWALAEGDLQTGQDLETACLVSLFSDILATPDFVPTDGTTDRRGAPVPLLRCWMGVLEMNRLLATFLGLLALASPALADMYQDGSNAKLPATGTPTTAVCGTASGSLAALPGGCFKAPGVATVEQWGPTIVTTGLSDTTASFNAALTAFSTAGGGEIFAVNKYLVTSGNLVIPSNVTLRGPWSHPGIAPNGDYTVMTGSLILDSKYSVQIMAQGGLQGMIVRASNLVPPGDGTLNAANLATLYAIRSNMYGTAICLGDCTHTQDKGSAAVVRDNLILGFGRCLDSPFNNLFIIEDNYGDCEFGFRFGDTGEKGIIARNHMWPFLTYGGPGGSNYNVYNYSASIQAVSNAAGKINVNIPGHLYSTGQGVYVTGATAANTNGGWQVTKVDANNITLNGSTFTTGSGAAGNVITNLLLRDGVGFEFYAPASYGCDHCDLDQPSVFGWAIGIKIDSSRNNSIIGARLDYPANLNDQYSNGILITGTAGQSITTSPQISGYGIGYYLKATGASAPYHTLVAPSMWGIQLRPIQADSGTLNVTGGALLSIFGGVCEIYGYGGTINLDGGLQLDPTCPLTRISGTINIGSVYRGATNIGIVSAANCTGQPSKTVIATTGTGALVQCP